MTYQTPSIRTYASTVIDNFPIIRPKQLGPDPTCPICTEPLGWPIKNQENDPARTPCGHVFHRDCIREWLAPGDVTQHDSCPLCRNHIELLMPGLPLSAFFDDGFAVPNVSALKPQERFIYHIVEGHEQYTRKVLLETIGLSMRLRESIAREIESHLKFLTIDQRPDAVVRCGEVRKHARNLQHILRFDDNGWEIPGVRLGPVNMELCRLRIAGISVAWEEFWNKVMEPLDRARFA